MQETGALSLVQEDPTCLGATKLGRHNYRAWAPPRLSPRELEPVLCSKRSHCSEKTASASREKPTRQWRPRTAKMKPHARPLSHRVRVRLRNQSMVSICYDLSGHQLPSFLCDVRTTEDTDTEETAGQALHRHGGLVRPESNNFTATASEHSICIKRDNSYLECTKEEWLKVTNLGFTWITINTENQFTLAWQKSPILTAHYSLDSIKKQFWVENSENLHLKF